jgi:hypothetical protein
MVALQLDFNCLCLFARDDKNNEVHVVMPRTHVGHLHVVRLIHPSFTNFPHGKPLEGLTLEVGTAGGADLKSLQPTKEGVIVDVSARSGKKVNLKSPNVITRFHLRSGKVVDRDAEATWQIDKDTVLMAHRVIWEIGGLDPTKALAWSGGTIPLVKLADLGSPMTLPVTGNSGYRLTVFHTTPDRLPPRDRGTLNEAEVREHFRHYYELLGFRPGDIHLPHRPLVPPVGTFNCGAAQGSTGP